jgi:hypothetical protein
MRNLTQRAQRAQRRSEDEEGIGEKCGGKRMLR